MVEEWIKNLSPVEIFLLFFAMAIAFYALNKFEKDKEKSNESNKKE